MPVPGVKGYGSISVVVSRSTPFFEVTLLPMVIEIEMTGAAITRRILRIWPSLLSPTMRIVPAIRRDRPKAEEAVGRPCPSFANGFYQDPFLSPAVKFAVKDLLPWPEIEFAVCHCHNDFAAHDLPLEVGICVVLTHVVTIL
jgi:hypothetical protein